MSCSSASSSIPSFSTSRAVSASETSRNEVSTEPSYAARLATVAACAAFHVYVVWPKVKSGPSACAPAA
jgi:hypothetical protein